MARYTTVVRSPMSQQEAFDYVADLRNFEDWDPGVKSSTQVVGESAGLGAEYDVELSTMTLRYKISEFREPERTKVEAHSPLLSSYDTIEVAETPDGSDIRYDAVIKLSGPLKLIDPLFALVFNRIGDKAAEGMVRMLNGTKVS
ncbi:MAG: hypothetical protein ACI8TP_001841 [Acidimicrobiales bacterium]|jgi:hypothetical protein